MNDSPAAESWVIGILRSYRRAGNTLAPERNFHVEQGEVAGAGTALRLSGTGDRRWTLEGVRAG
jgi:hypothetical protein